MGLFFGILRCVGGLLAALSLRLLSCRICFPIQVNRLPRETLLSVTLFAVPVPPPGSSSDTNKQRRVPEALGWVTTPLFNFRQCVGRPRRDGHPWVQRHPPLPPPKRHPQPPPSTLFFFFF